MKAKILVLMLAAALFCGFGNALALDGDSTSTVWVSFAGDGCTVNGVLLPVGALVDAYSPSGVHCGHQVISSAGLYKWMAVYGRDVNTPVSSGFCQSNDHVIFKVNGIEATELGPGTDEWTTHGDTKIMRLAILQTFGVSATAPAGTTDTSNATVQYDVQVTNDGNGDDIISFSVASKSGWTVTGADPVGQYYGAGQSKTLSVTVAIPPLTPDGYQDTLIVTATSMFDPTATASATKKIVTVVSNTTGVDDGNFNIPGMFRLNQNFPNPFNPETVISFSLEKAGEVTLTVYDILGRTVTTLQQGYLPAGQHEFRWNGADQYGQTVSSGVYFYRLAADKISLTRKMVLMK